MSTILDDLDTRKAHDYNFSGPIYDESSDNIPSTDDEQILNSASRHTSVSSFPASVLHHEIPATPKSPIYNRATTPTYSPRPHSTGFRHPSSVRAMQMQDEFETTDGEDLSYRRRQRYTSFRSSGSFHSSPTKSLRNRSTHGSPNKRLKEYPLVLLHCTLLPPRLSARASLLSDSNDKESLLEAIIPEPYVKRWKTLQEKVVKNSEVKCRGVLIPHPRDEYELLEERLLESLELERPRIREGHYLHKSEPATDSGFESGGTDSDSIHEGTASSKCPDCGHSVSSSTEQERKWEVKVFAANGLMRAGAWGAAWSEMEKVDVEVGIWMPEDVRREVDERLDALIAKDQEEQSKMEGKRMDDERTKEIYGENSGRSQADIDGLPGKEPSSTPILSSPERQHETPVDITILLKNYIRLLAQDGRNIAILLLSMLVLFYGISAGGSNAETRELNLRPVESSATPNISDHFTADSLTSRSSVVTSSACIESNPVSSSISSTLAISSLPTVLVEETVSAEIEPSVSEVEEFSKEVEGVVLDLFGQGPEHDPYSELDIDSESTISAHADEPDTSST